MSVPSVVTVVGARPQFVKASVVSRALARREDVIEHVLHTGQHHDSGMSDVFFAELDVPEPRWWLGISGGPHGAMTGAMLVAVERVLLETRPAAVLVYGDTNSTLAGALAAVKLHVPVVHVEAGLRSFNRRMPEEINRVLVDHASRLLLAPTRAAVEHLRREGITEGVEHVGDVMHDAALHAAARADALDLDAARPSGPYAVATVHRAESTDDPRALGAVFSYLREQAGTMPVVLPLHPRTAAALRQHRVPTDGLSLRPPLGYLEMTALLRSAALVLTDSGGLQKEAYFHRVPCVTLRSETEWVETVTHGWNRLWTTESWLPRRPIEDYGDGRAGAVVAARIAELVKGAASP